ncbi:GPI ethanolamine phosphate transferase 1-like [Cimex lectularius]|uniref:GPI ethanolamine phosphate transferase 1 n=1 Tax=Cimex lectularius TaxID=79782 RepID=A0A8I6RXX4_CIMLE|nr:GPI ethanolamine phosphate transferase 1-like [Cimex lectularius]
MVRIGSLKKVCNYLPGRHLLTTWLFSIWVHFVLLIGVMDLNRHEVPVSPATVSSPRDVKSSAKDSPVRRLVVFHVDGLAPLRFSAHIDQQPKLTAIVARKGSWGITKSPSYITKRQKMLSTFTGSYWAKGVGILEQSGSVYFVGDPKTAEWLTPLGNKLRAFTWQEPSWDKYSYMSDDKAADEWVQKQTLALLNTKTFPEINRDKAVIMIRFVGHDMSGELEGENSLRAKDALVRILAMITNIITVAEDKWNDQRTTFAILSDSNESPIVTWGPAISSALVPEPNPSNINWKSPYTKRRDMDRRSVAPLLACILDVEPPIDSVAGLPIDFLEEKPRMKAQCSSKTATQIMKLFLETAKHHQSYGRIKLTTLWTSITQKSAIKMSDIIDGAYEDGDYLGVIAASKILTDRCLRGMHYYGEFKRKFSTYLLLLTVLGWTFACATWLCPRLDIDLGPAENGPKTVVYCRPRVIFDIVMALVSTGLIVVCCFDGLPWRFHSYLLTPCFIWWTALRDSQYWMKVYKCSMHPEAMSFVSGIYVAFAGICWSIISDRLSLSLLLVGTLTFSSFFSMMKTKSVRLKIWLLTSIPFIVLLHDRANEIDEDSGLTHVMSAVAWICAVSFISKIASAKLGDSPILVANVISLIAILFKGTSGMAPASYHLAWLVALFLPLIGSCNIIMRLCQIFFSLCTPFFLLSTGSEPLSLLGLLFHASTWYLAECYSNCENSEILKAELSEGDEGTRKFGTNDSRRVFFYMVYVILATSAVRITDNLIVYNGDFTKLDEQIVSVTWWAKGFVPILCISCLLILLWKKSNGDELALGLAVLFMCSLMSFLFLFMVLAGGEEQNKLQWSVSHYFAGQYISIVTILSLPASYVLTVPSILSKYISSPYNQPAHTS